MRSPVMATTSTTVPETTDCADSHADGDGAVVHAAPARGHIGRIVAGSVVGGLVAAIVFVTGPFAGAQEHVITGSVLLAFAAAWAMLAVLSERWTDQPQRWAFVPAAFMALTAAGIVAFAPTGN